MDLALKDKVALVCASSRGLGRAVAEELAREGARLIMSARGAEALEAARADIASKHGVTAIAVAADLGDPTEASRVIDAGIAELGQIDILVSNIGGPPPGPFDAHSPEAWNQAAQQNLMSVIHLCRAVVPGMKERGWGRIINITSIAAKEPVANLILSNTMRAGVAGFAKTLASEVAPHGITVNNVLPGYTRTERLEQLAGNLAAGKGTTPDQIMDEWAASIPAGRVGEPEEFAAVVTFLASERASYVTGTSLAVDGGRSRGLL